MAVVELVPGKNDQELANEFKDRIIEAYQPLLEVLTEADAHGFIVQAEVGKTGMGKVQMMNLNILKKF